MLLSFQQRKHNFFSGEKCKIFEQSAQDGNKTAVVKPFQLEAQLEQKSLGIVARVSE